MSALATVTAMTAAMDRPFALLHPEASNVDSNATVDTDGNITWWVKRNQTSFASQSFSTSLRADGTVLLQQNGLTISDQTTKGAGSCMLDNGYMVTTGHTQTGQLAIGFYPPSGTGSVIHEYGVQNFNSGEASGNVCQDKTNGNVYVAASDAANPMVVTVWSRTGTFVGVRLVACTTNVGSVGVAPLQSGGVVAAALNSMDTTNVLAAVHYNADLSTHWTSAYVMSEASVLTLQDALVCSNSKEDLWIMCGGLVGGVITTFLLKINPATGAHTAAYKYLSDNVASLGGIAIDEGGDLYVCTNQAPGPQRAVVTRLNSATLSPKWSISIGHSTNAVVVTSVCYAVGFIYVSGTVVTSGEAFCLRLPVDTPWTGSIVMGSVTMNVRYGPNHGFATTTVTTTAGATPTTTYTGATDSTADGLITAGSATPTRYLL